MARSTCLHLVIRTLASYDHTKYAQYRQTNFYRTNKYKILQSAYHGYFNRIFYFAKILRHLL
jgi:hypothetical protein